MSSFENTFTQKKLKFPYRVLFLGSMIHVYVYLFENYRILDLAPNSIWTWIISLLLVEFVYYWTHRALHEFNILWAAHQFHHMAEDLNVTTAIRDSIVDLILYDVSIVLLTLNNLICNLA